MQEWRVGLPGFRVAGVILPDQFDALLLEPRRIEIGSGGRTRDVGGRANRLEQVEYAILFAARELEGGGIDEFGGTAEEVTGDSPN